MARLGRWLRRQPKAPEPTLPGMKAVGRNEKLAGNGRRSYSLGDAILIGMGIGLTAASATFPWYVFYNQEKFGLGQIAFDNDAAGSDLTGPFYTPRVQWTPKPLTSDEIASLPIDFAPTGTVGSIKTPPPLTDQEGATQAFPATVPNFSLIHVANGRAMIQSDNGLFVVERGSVLPDNSRVVAIEFDGAKWVLRTSDNAVVEMTP